MHDIHDQTPSSPPAWSFFLSPDMLFQTPANLLSSHSQSSGKKSAKEANSMQGANEPAASGQMAAPAAPSANTPADPTDAAIARLKMPARKVQVAMDHANADNAQRHQGGIQAYAKLAGATWTYYIQSLTVTIGRTPEDEAATDTQKPEDAVEIDLGPAKVVSRNHARIEYNFVSRYWELHVNGRNGVKIQNKLYKKDGKVVKLKSG